MGAEKQVKTEYHGYLLSIGSAIGFGLMPLFSRLAYGYGCNSYTVSLFRFVFSALILGTIHICSPRLSFRITKEQFKKLLLMSVFYSLTTIFLYTSYEMIDTVLASGLHFTYPLSVMIISSIVFRKLPDKKELLCIVLCMAGIFLLNVPQTRGSFAGMLLAVGSGVTYASYAVTLSASKISDLPSETITFWIAVFSIVQIGLVTLLTGNFAAETTAAGYLSVFGLAAAATVLPMILFQKGCFIIGEIRATLLATLEPITSVSVGVIAFHEILTGRMAAGIFLILFAAALLVLPKSKA